MHRLLFPTGFGDLLDLAPWMARLYRAYAVGLDGHFKGFTARDDDGAIAKATRLLDGHDVELWSGERFVTAGQAREVSSLDRWN